MRYCADNDPFFRQHFDSFCRILGGIKYYPPNLPVFHEPFPVSDSSRKQAKFENYQTETTSRNDSGFVNFAVYKQVEKSKINPSLFELFGDF